MGRPAGRTAVRRWNGGATGGKANGDGGNGGGATDGRASGNATGGKANAAQIIAKIENDRGVRNIRAIAEIADGVMIARGDLGIQLPMERIPLVQKHIITHCNAMGTPVVTATQMLESMVRNPRPTRAEMTDVANAIFDGTDAVMLSGETAIGAYPIQSIDALNRIALAVECSPEFIAHNKQLLTQSDTVTSSSDAIAKSSCLMAHDVEAACIIVPTARGHGPRLIARYRSAFPVIAPTPSATVIRQLLIHWGIFPLQTTEATDDSDMLQNAIDIAKDSGYARRHQWVITVAGLPLKSPVTLNTISARYMGKILKRGRRACGGTATGRVAVVKSGGDIDRVRAAIAGVQADSAGESDTIAVIERLTERHIAVLGSIRGVISERMSTLTPERIRAENPSIVVIEQIDNACGFFRDGQRIHINGLEKTVYES